jgi:hypothetical protein
MGLASVPCVCWVFILYFLFALRDSSLGPYEEESSCPASPVLSIQPGGFLDERALTRSQRNSQVVILAFVRIFMPSSHTPSLNKQISDY